MNRIDLIRTWSDKILHHLLEYRKSNPDFKFWLRNRGAEKLENGYWFQGNDNYIFLSFWNRSGGTNMTRSMGFVVWFDKTGKTSTGFEIAYNEEKDDALILLYTSLATRHNMKVVSNTKYCIQFPENDPLLSLESFLKKFKPDIDNSIISANKEFIFITNQKFNEMLNKILSKRNDSVSAKAPNMPSSPQPLNRILYGPPGTGKTYSTIYHALSIVEKKSIDELKAKPRKEIRELFDNYISKRQIVFVTFHQSLGYEDFIEGIKPLKPDAANKTDVLYDIKDGIFMEICLAADRALKGVEVPKQEKLYDDFITEISRKLESGDVTYSSKSGTKVIVHSISDQGSLYASPEKESHELRDYLISKEKLLKLDAHFKKIGDIKNVVEDIRNTIKGVGHTYYWAVLNEFKKYKEQKEESTEITPGSGINKYVLIIDEINRGNVSQIFGELISLIEEDKRKGMTEALEAVLPYSQRSFSVPSNLYLIGTMNTADRSVEALDSALRRRFEFFEVAPEPALLSPHRMLWEFWWETEEFGWHDREYVALEENFYELIGFPEELDDEAYKEKYWSDFKKHGKNEQQIEKLKEIPFDQAGTNLQNLLYTINLRLEVLIGKEHQIGHSYFIKIRSYTQLKETFFKNIIPLLQEYFFSDYGKIGLVLGNGFVAPKLEGNENNVFADFEYDDYNSLGRKIYQIRPEEQVDIRQAIRILLKELTHE